MFFTSLREKEGKRHAPALFVPIYFDGTAVLGDDLVDHREAEAGAAVLSGKEGVEDTVEVMGGDAIAFVLHLDEDAIAGPKGAEQHLPPSRHGLDGVDGEVEDDLRELLFIAEQTRQAAGSVAAEGDAFPAGVAHQFDHVVEDLGNVDGAAFGRAGAGEIEQVGEQAEEAGALFSNDGKGFAADLFGLAPGGEDLGRAINAGEGIADFVGEPGGELADGGEAVGAFYLFEGVLQFDVHLFELAGGDLQFGAARALAVGEDTGDDADREKHEDFGVLFERVFLVVGPGGDDVGDVEAGGDEAGDESANPTEGYGGIDDGEVVEALEEGMPEAQAGGREVVAGAGDGDAEGDESEGLPVAGGGVW